LLYTVSGTQHAVAGVHGAASKSSTDFPLIGVANPRLLEGSVLNRLELKIFNVVAFFCEEVHLFQKRDFAEFKLFPHMVRYFERRCTKLSKVSHFFEIVLNVPTIDIKRQ
jgi:hypothetical protein